MYQLTVQAGLPTLRARSSRRGSTINTDVHSSPYKPKPPDYRRAVDVQEVHFSRAGKPIFNGLNLDVRRGKITALMGPSGTGKTTLLKLIGGQLRPSRGIIYFDGQDVHALGNEELYELRRRMGMLFQNGALLTDLNAFENVAFPLREHTRLPEPVLRDLVLMKLQAVGLRSARELMPGELSGGMARRVALARAIVLDPMVVMYDEPFSGLDPITRGTIVSLIRELNRTLGLTSIVVSHDVEETLSIADYTFVMAGGKVIDSGTSINLRNSSSEWVQQFLRGEPDGPVPFHYPGTAYAEDLLAEN